MTTNPSAIHYHLAIDPPLSIISPLGANVSDIARWQILFIIIQWWVDISIIAWWWILTFIISLWWTGFFARWWSLTIISRWGPTLSIIAEWCDVPSPLSLLSDRTPSESPSLDSDRPSPSSSLRDSLLNGFQQMMDDTFETRELFEPLYQGADITVCGAYCCIMQSATTNKLTYTAISELVKLLHLIYPPQNKLPSSFIS